MSLLAPKCPLSASTQSWMEQRMLWLVPQVGVRRVLNAEVALPTKAHFPEVFQRPACDVATLFEHACRLIGVDCGEFHLRVATREQLGSAVALYDGDGEHATITVRQDSLEDPEVLLAAMFRKLALHLLINRQRIEADEPDLGPTTDLVPLILGLGVFAANAVTRESPEPAMFGTGMWQIVRNGCLSAQEHGYGLALFAWFRGEHDPAWIDALRPDVRVAAKEGLRYLRADGACPFHPDELDANGLPRIRLTVREYLGSPRPATIITGLRVLKGGMLGADLHASITAALAHADLAVRIEAHEMLARMDRAPASMSGLVVDAIYAADGLTRAAATRALGSFDGSDPALQKAAERALRDRDHDVVANACRALQRWKRAPWSTSQLLVEIALKYLLVGDDDLGNAAMAAFAAVTPDAESALRKLETERDEEERTVLEQSLMAALWPESDSDEVHHEGHP